MSEEWKDGWILAGKFGSTNTHVVQIQFQPGNEGALIQLEGLIEAQRWEHPIYASRLAALKVQLSVAEARLTSAKTQIMLEEKMENATT